MEREPNLAQHSEIVKITETDEGLGALVRVGSANFDLVWTNSLDRNVVDPETNRAMELLSGEVRPSLNPEIPYALLMPLQANGRCYANCIDCVFAKDPVDEAMKGLSGSNLLGTPVNGSVAKELLRLSKQMAQNAGILRGSEPIRMNFLLSGDPSFNPYMLDIMKMTAYGNPKGWSRTSTVAVETRNDPIDTFVEGAKLFAKLSPDHTPRFQVSLHSTDPEKRLDYVTGGRRNLKLKLITTERISEAFDKIYSITEQQSTLAFVLHPEIVLDPNVLRKQFSPMTTVISLRPKIDPVSGSVEILSDHMEIYAKLYVKLKDAGYTVLIIPSSVSGNEQDNKSLKNALETANQGL